MKARVAKTSRARDMAPGGTGPEGPTVMRRVGSVACSLMRHETVQVLKGSCRLWMHP